MRGRIRVWFSYDALGVGSTILANGNGCSRRLLLVIRMIANTFGTNHLERPVRTPRRTIPRLGWNPGEEGTPLAPPRDAAPMARYQSESVR
jgi:hypothetical protein